MLTINTTTNIDSSKQRRAHKQFEALMGTDGKRESKLDEKSTQPFESEAFNTQYSQMFRTNYSKNFFTPGGQALPTITKFN